MPSKRRKHIPLRSCIACQAKRPKRELIRIVRRPEGTIEIDPRGKLSGRGAYLCLTRECIELALDQNRISRALKCQMDAEDQRALRAAAESLLMEKMIVGSQTPPVQGQSS